MGKLSLGGEILPLRGEIHPIFPWRVNFASKDVMGKNNPKRFSGFDLHRVIVEAQGYLRVITLVVYC